ncbi:RNA helicase Mov10l1 isoform X1 [Xenopus tropicalis]|uniref:RNA helicase n=1 Tax=Xenopus tropicalis TaxID=8364 RepID=A0A6I8RHV2_XENTR|nr:RNA helicase Mov10l1 isoform X1 [Xenopus tropicalis]
MISVLSRVGSFFWRRAGEEEKSKSSSDSSVIRNMDGVVTRFCNDYGMINDQVYFTSDAVIGREPLSVGQKVNVAYEEDKTSGGLRAIMVHVISNKWENYIPSNENSQDLNIRVLIGCVTSCNKDGGDINQTTCFSMCDVCEGYVPYKGDWVKAEYFINQSTWNSEAYSVKPLRCKRVDQMKITAFYGTSGVIAESIFFTMDSIRLPKDYHPRRDDLVNAVVVESSQSCYVWRALCIAPVNTQSLSAYNATDSLYQCSAVLMMNKGGLEVSRMTNFGVIKQGQTKQMQIYIENKGNEPHTLISCKLAGWEKENKFKLEMSKPKSESMSDTTQTAQAFSFPPRERQMSVSVTSYCEKDKADLHQTAPFSVLTNNELTAKFCQLGYKVSSATPSLFNNCTKFVRGSTDPLSSGLYGPLRHCPEPSDDPMEQPVLGATIHEEQSCNMDSNVNSGVTDSVLQHSSNAPTSEVVILPGEKTFIIVTCEARNPGRCKELLLLCFSDFMIGRCLEGTVESEEESFLLPPVEFASKQKKVPQEYMSNSRTVLSAPHKRISRRQLPSFLPLYPIPDRLRKCTEQKMDILALEPCLGEVLTLSNYRKRMSTLLWLEDIHAEMEIQEFSLSGVCLQKRGGFLLLEVPGIAEGRPFLNQGDKVFLKYQELTTTAIQFVGLIVEIHEEEITLRVNEELEQSYKFEPMDVEFVVNRVTSRRCQFAVEQAEHLGQKVLFPDTVELQSPQVASRDTSEIDCPEKKEKTGYQETNQSNPTSRGKNAVYMSDMVTVATQTSTKGSGSPVKKKGQFFNNLLNNHQKLAVKRILGGECRPTPYILFGPPGTGKTVTIIEAILQIYYALPDSRILVCAPSNSAADLVCLRLHQSNQLEPGSMVRVNATCRLEETICDAVRPYCGPGEDIRKASRFRIIISTCSSAGMFYQIGLRVGHFTHVFVDEAGQASEPECLIPLGLISEVTGQIILAGDPMQLGPIIKSRVSLAYGLNVSFLERLMARPLYLRDEESYGACGNYNPLLGTEMREGSNPSWFNPSEAVQAMRYCCVLAKHVTTSVSAKDIGVITPYRKQVEKIRTLLRTADLSDIKVGSVEEFQGQEFLVIIISMVRSCEDSLHEDSRHLLGFLCSPKRFNVAITRPKALLIVLGNPHVLVKDPCICALLEYSVINGAYTGCNLPPGLETLQQCD